MNYQSAYDQLSPTERGFVDAYVKALAEAAARANERLSDILGRPLPADHVAASQGLLNRPLVVAAVAEKLKQAATNAELSPQRLINEYMLIAFSNMKDYFGVGYDGNPTMELHNVSDEKWRAISEIKTDYAPSGAVRQISIKLHSKMDALAQLGKYMAVLMPNNPYWKLDNGGNVPILPDNVGADEASNMYARLLSSQ